MDTELDMGRRESLSSSSGMETSKICRCVAGTLVFLMADVSECLIGAQCLFSELKCRGVKKEYSSD